MVITKSTIIQSSILIVLASVSITAVVITAAFTYSVAKQALKEESFKKLTAAREMKAN